MGIDFLKKYSTPTVANAIELFEIRPRTAGYMLPGVRCHYPEFGPVAGYAVTVMISAEDPGHHGAVNRLDYWRYVAGAEGPRMVVVQDIDSVPGRGSMWGEVNANIHKALGAVGVVTNGAVRDLDEMRHLGFHAFSHHVTVSHACVHLTNFGVKVSVGGMTVQTGDVIHADQHGVLLVPKEVLPDLEEAVEEMVAREAPVIRYCQTPGFTPEGLLEEVNRNLVQVPKWRPKAKA